MRKKFSYNGDQVKEMDLFYQCCLSENIAFESYDKLCDFAEQFRKRADESNIIICSTIALLSMSALIRYRNDNLNEIVKRDFVDSKSYRISLPLYDFLRQNENKVWRDKNGK